MKALQALLGHTPAALLFDLDGTLVDSVPDIARAVDRMLQDLGLQQAGEEQVRHWVGNGAPMLVARALGWAWGSQLPELGSESHQAGLERFFEHYQKGLCEHSRLYPGVADALQSWADQGMPMACVTNKPGRFTEPLLRQLGLDRYMPVAISGDSLAVKKPDPAPLLEACRRLAVSPRHTVMLGDSRADVEAARAAGMPVVAVSYGYNYGRSVASENPDLLVDSLVELLAA